MLTKNDLLSFIQTELQTDDLADEHTELFSMGLLDSVSMLQLITFIEGKASFEIPASDVTLENFDTVERICDYLAKVSG